MKRNLVILLLIVSIVLAVTSCAGSRGCPATSGKNFKVGY